MSESILTTAARGIDRLVGVLSPGAELRRQGLRAMGRAARLSSKAYDGAASGSRSWHNRSVQGGSADADLDEDALSTLRERSRDRDRNDPVAHAMIASFADNVVGVGFRPQLALDAARLGISEDRARDLRAQARWIWEEWAPRADSCNRLAIEDMQRLVFASVLVNGDHFAQPVMVQDARVRSRFELKLEMIEADRVDTPIGLVNDRVRNGVELGRRGQPVAYHVARSHPGDDLRPGSAAVGRRTFRRIPAHGPSGRPNILHCYHQERAGQSRGRPVLSTVLGALKDRDDYSEAELIAAQVGACFAAFVTKTDPWTAAVQRGTDDTKGKENRHEELSPGAVMYLSPGEEVSFGNPSRPNAAYESYLGAKTREIISGVGLAYGTALRDHSKTTYSQARADLLEVRRMFAERQKWFSRCFLQPVWEMLLEEAWLKGDFDAGSDFLEMQRAWTRTVWVPPGWGWIDPQKEVGAWEKALEMGITTRADVINTVSGGDFEDTTRTLADEERLRRELLTDDQAEPEPAAPAPETEQQAEPDPESAPSDVDVFGDARAQADAYGVAVRSGAVTPQPDDEDSFRDQLGLPAMSQAVRDAWEAEGGVRRPITLTEPGAAVASGTEPASETDTDSSDAAPGEVDDDDETPDQNDDEGAQESIPRETVTT